jgi:hypothetical protein
MRPIPNYKPPTAAELRQLLSRWGLSQARAADALNVTSATMYRYCTDVNRMPYPALCTLAIWYEGVRVTRWSWREELNINESAN